MLDFADSPYEYVSSKRNAVIVSVAGFYNRTIQLPKNRRIMGVETLQGERLKTQLRPGDRLLLLPNHPTHADPEIFFEALRQTGLTTQFMVAYEVFQRSRVNAFVIRRVGGFSVDREGADMLSANEAMATLRVGRHALTLFPEGNVYLQNDVAGLFNDGAAFLGLKVALDLPAPARVMAVPVTIKVTHLTDVLPERLARLRAMAADLKTVLPAEIQPLDLLRHVGLAALRQNLKRRGFDLQENGSLPEVIRQTAEEVLGRLETKMGIASRAKDVPIERVRHLRRVIHQIRIDPARAADHKVAAAWADEAMVAFKIASYAGNYVESRPTLDRFAETVEKLDEDIYSRMPSPYAPRHAFVRFGDPIDLSDEVETAKKKLRRAVENVTQKVEQSVQAGLDELNARNPHAGGKPL